MAIGQRTPDFQGVLLLSMPHLAFIYWLPAPPGVRPGIQSDFEALLAGAGGAQRHMGYPAAWRWMNHESSDAGAAGVLARAVAVAPAYHPARRVCPHRPVLPAPSAARPMVGIIRPDIGSAVGMAYTAYLRLFSYRLWRDCQ